MQNFLTYILEVSILTSIFFLFYRYLYYKLAYFAWSRYFFYLILFASLIIPLLPSVFSTDLIFHKIENIFGASINTKTAYINVENSFLTEKETLFSKVLIIKILFIIWISGFLRYMFFITKSVLSIIFLIKKSEKKQDGDFVIVKTKSNNAAFSFFKYIFINLNFDKLQKAEQEQVIKHEKIHAKQKHTLDNIIFEIFRAVFWFNPVSKLIVTNVKIIHEFIVDNVLTGNRNVPNYSKLIVKMASERMQKNLVSNFSKQEIKNRINLITFPEKEKNRKKIFTISIPILIVTIFAMWFVVSTINVYAFNNENDITKIQHPFNKGTYKIISPFFEKKEVNGITVSHKEISYELKSFSNIYSVKEGVIIDISEKDIFGLKEYSLSEKLNNGQIIIYKGLYKIKVKINDSVSKGRVIGISGDIRLYPKIEIQLIENGKAINPIKVF